MSQVGQREIQTQKRVVAFFQDALDYACLGHWKHREGNANIEEALLAAWLQRQGHGDRIINKVLHELGKAAALGGSKTLYDANREVYGLLRYGVKVRPEVGEQTETVWLIDCILNKTPISCKANRKVGGEAPSRYLPRIQNEKQVQLDDAAMDELLASHALLPDLLRQDAFDDFLEDRRRRLSRLVETAMAKPVVQVAEGGEYAQTGMCRCADKGGPAEEAPW